MVVVEVEDLIEIRVAAQRAGLVMAKVVVVVWDLIG
jgi:hypothetical protein